MSLLDILAGAAPALAPALRGYTGGLAQGEQAKINLLRQQHLDQLNEQQMGLNNDYRNQMLELQKGKLAYAEAHPKTAADPQAKAWSTFGGALLLKIASDPDLQAKLSEVPGRLENLTSLAKKAVSGVELSQDEAQHLFGFAQASSQRDAANGTQGGGLQAPAATPNIIPPKQPAVAEPFNPEAPIFGGVNPATASSQPAPTPYQGLPYSAPAQEDMAAKRAAAGASTAAAGLSGARQREVETKIPTIVPESKSLINQRTASAENLRATAAATPQKVTETNRHNQAMEAIGQGANRIKRIMSVIAQQNANTSQLNVKGANELRRAQINHLNAEVRNLSFNMSPVDKAVFGKLQLYTPGPNGTGLIPVPENIKTAEAILSKYGVQPGVFSQSIHSGLTGGVNTGEQFAAPSGMSHSSGPAPVTPSQLVPSHPTPNQYNAIPTVQNDPEWQGYAAKLEKVRKQRAANSKKGKK